MTDYQREHSDAYHEACRKHVRAVEAATRRRRQARKEIDATYRHALDLAAHAYRIDMEHADRALEQAIAAADADPPF